MDGGDIGALAARLATRVVVVARPRSGTINHSLLTLEAVERDGMRVEALVLFRRPEERRGLPGGEQRRADPEVEDEDYLVASNVEQIRKLWPA